MTTEVWKPILNFESLYQVSSFGRVRRIDSGQIRTGTKLESGYIHIHLYKGNKYYGRYIHRLVLEAFLGECPLDMESFHYDNDKGNNYLTNLDWKTPSINKQHIVASGNHHEQRFSDNEVTELRQRTWPRGTLTQFCKERSISQQTLFNLLAGRTYKHISVEA